MTCCNHKCNQGPQCPYRQRLTSIARALASFGVGMFFLTLLVSIIAVMVAK